MTSYNNQKGITYTIRKMEAHEYPLLKDFCYESISIAGLKWFPVAETDGRIGTIFTKNRKKQIDFWKNYWKGDMNPL